MELIQIGQPPTCHGESSDGTQIDAVCGMTVDPASAAGSYRYGGQEYYFCSRHCLEKFRINPQQYLASNSDVMGRPMPAARPAVPEAKYTCPMHPEVVQDGPGACPKCGMALEPVVPSAGAEDDSELRDMTRRFWIALVLTLPVFILSMAPMIPGVS